MGLDDRQSGQRATTCVFRKTSGALEQAGVEVENVTWISFAAGWAAENQRHLAVSDGVFGKVIEHDQNVLTFVHEVFGDRTTGIRSKVLHRGGVRSGGGNNGGVFHRAGVFEDLLGPGDVRELLADRDVDTIERLVVLQFALFSGLILDRLGNDGVDCNGRLTGCAVTDDQLPLATAHGDHRVDRHDTGLDRHRNGLPLDDARGDFFHRVVSRSNDVAFAVDRSTERVDHAAEKCFTDWDGEKLTGRAALRTFGHRRVVAEKHDADFAFFEVERHPGDTTVEFDHLVEHDVGKAFDLRHAVSDLADGSDVGFFDGGSDTGDLLLEFLEDAAHLDGVRL